jgi:hypothetical protein
VLLVFEQGGGLTNLVVFAALRLAMEKRRLMSIVEGASGAIVQSLGTNSDAPILIEDDDDDDDEAG